MKKIIYEESKNEFTYEVKIGDKLSRGINDYDTRSIIC